MVEDGQYGARDQPHRLRALSCRTQEQQRIRREAAIRRKVMLDDAHVRKAELLAKCGQPERILKIVFRTNLVPDRRKELQPKFHVPGRFLHRREPCPVRSALI